MSIQSSFYMEFGEESLSRSLSFSRMNDDKQYWNGGTTCAQCSIFERGFPTSVIPSVSGPHPPKLSLFLLLP